MVFKGLRYTQNSNVILQKEEQTFIIDGHGEQGVKHNRWNDGSGNFQIGTFRVPYTVHETNGKKRMFISNSMGYDIVKDDKTSEIVNLLIMPVVRVIAKRDGLQVVYPDWLTKVIQDQARKSVTKFERTEPVSK
jgi:hypothetical protein